jgi:hypothetical protein
MEGSNPEFSFRGETMNRRKHLRVFFLCLFAAFLAVVVLTLGASERAQAEPTATEPTGDPGSGWITDEMIDFIPNIDQNPVLAAGPGGTLHAAWQHDTDGLGAWGICYSNSFDGGESWSPCTLVGIGIIATNPDIAVSPQDGRIFIAFENEQIVGNRDIIVAFSDDGVVWNGVMVGLMANDEFNPSIVLEHDMPMYLVHVAYQEDVPGGGHDLHVYGSADRGSSWLPMYDYGIGDSGVYSNPKLEYQRCTDALPRLYMLYIAGTTEVHILWSEDNGMTWLGPGFLWGSLETMSGLTVASSRNGDTLIVAWEEQRPGDYWIRYVYDPDPTTPSAGWFTGVLDTMNLNDRTPELSADGEGTMSTVIGGKFHVAWTVATIRVEYTYMNTNMTGGAAPFDSPSDSVAVHVQGGRIGLTTQDRGGTWYPAISWMDYRTGDADIYYTTPGSRVTVDANVTGVYVFIDGQNITLPGAFNWPAGLDHWIDLPSPQYINATARVVWLDWSDTGAQNHSVQATTFDTTYTAGFMFQYRNSFIGAPVGGLEARIDGAYELLPKSYWWFMGSDHEILAPSPQLETPLDNRWVFDYWSDGGPQLHDITVLGDRTYTCYFIREYYVTIETNPPGLDVEIDAPTYVAPQYFWWEEGSMHNLNAPSPQPFGPNARYVFQSWSDSQPQSHMITVTGPDTYTAYFVTQYLIGFDTNPMGLEVVIDTITYPTPTSFWWDDLSSHFIDVVSPQSVMPGEQFIFSQWSDMGPQGHIITVTGSNTFTATFTTQYYLTVTSPYGITNGEGWYDESTDAYAGLDTEVFVVVPNANRFLFTQWSGDSAGPNFWQSSPIFMDSPKTAVALWQEQFYLTVSSPYGITSGEGWYDDGTLAYAGLDTDMYVVTPNAERYLFSSWGSDATGFDFSQSDPIDMTMPMTATALWTQQFYLIVDSMFGTTFGEGWYDSMATAYAGLDVDVWIVIPEERYIFYQWAGDATGTDYLQSDPIVMDSAKLAQADWTHQFYLTVNSPYGTTSGEGWYDGGTLAYAGLDIDMYVVTPNAERWYFSNWGGDATGSDFSMSDPINMDQPMWAIAQWMQQFYLTVTSPYGTPWGEGWYDAGDTIYAGLDIGTLIISPNQERYVFLNWGVDASGTDYSMSDPITMDAPKTAEAIWQHEYYLDVQSPYGATSGSGWHEEMTAVPAGLDIDVYVVTPNAERWIFNQWGGDATGADYSTSDPILMDGPKTAVAQWTHQYYLTVDTPQGVPAGEGWYEDGVDAYAGLDTDTVVITPFVERYIFEGWDADATGVDYIASDPILMNGPKTAVAAWVHQFWMVIRAESGGTPLTGITVSTDAGAVGTTPYSEWFNAGLTHNIGVEDPADVSGTDYEFLYWDIGPTDNPVSYTVLASATIIAEYQEIIGPYFEIYITPLSRTIAAGEVTTYDVSISSHNGYAGNVSLSLTGLTAPALGTFNPEYVVLTVDDIEVSILTISNTGSLTENSHALTVYGNDGTMTDSEDAILNVSGVAPTGWVSGTVLDQDLVPLAGVVVDLMVDQTVLSTLTSDSSGNFNFTDLSAGTYTVRAVLSGYADDNETVVLTPGSWETVTLRLDEIRGSVSGIVKDEETLAVIEGATVEAYDIDGNLLGSDTSSPTGRFTIQDLPLGTFDLRAWADGYEMETVANLQATVSAHEVDVGDVLLTPEPEPSGAAGLADYWWLILILVVVIVLLLVLLAKRRKPEVAEEPSEETEALEEETAPEEDAEAIGDEDWDKMLEETLGEIE